MTASLVFLCCSLSCLSSIQVKENLFANADFSSSTVHTALRGANRVTDLYPKEFEQGCCMNTRDRHEYDTFNPDQIICIPSDRDADGSIDIVMSSREGKVLRRTEADDRIAWKAMSKVMPPGRLFPWENLPREATKGAVLEFVAEMAQKNNLSLIDITVFPVSCDHTSLTVRSGIVKDWSRHIEDISKEENISSKCSRFLNDLMSQYLNHHAAVDETTPARPRKKARSTNKALLVPKSVFIESSITSSNDDMPSFSGSMEEVQEFGKRIYKDGEVIVDLKSVFDITFPNMHIELLSRKVRDHKGRKITLWQAEATGEHRGEPLRLYSGYTPTQPSGNVTLDDYSTWYYKETGATAAFIWYNLTTGANSHWRKRWFCHLLSGQPEMLLRRSMFDQEDAVVRLFVKRNRVTNKKTHAITYPIG